MKTLALCLALFALTGCVQNVTHHISVPMLVGWDKDTGEPIIRDMSRQLTIRVPWFTNVDEFKTSFYVEIDPAEPGAHPGFVIDQGSGVRGFDQSTGQNAALGSAFDMLAILAAGASGDPMAVMKMMTARER